MLDDKEAEGPFSTAAREEEHEPVGSRMHARDVHIEEETIE